MPFAYTPIRLSILIKKRQEEGRERKGGSKEGGREGKEESHFDRPQPQIEPITVLFCFSRLTNEVNCVFT